MPAKPAIDPPDEEPPTADEVEATRKFEAESSAENEEDTLDDVQLPALYGGEASLACLQQTSQ